MNKPKHPTIPMSAVKSSQIESIGHMGNTLAVRFKRGGPEYRYSGVSVEDFNKLRNAESIGNHFSQHIKGKFDFKKVE